MTAANGHAVEQAIPAKRYQFPTPEEVTLPFSGVTVYARRVSVTALMAMGADFGPLQAASAKLTEEGLSDRERFDRLMKDRTSREAYQSLLEAVTRRVLVRPRVVDRQEDVKDPARHVWIDDIDFEDRQHLWAWNQIDPDDEEGKEAADDALAFLPDEGGTAPSVQPVQDGDGDRKPAK